MRSNLRYDEFDWFSGRSLLPDVRAVYADRLATWEAWEAVSNAAQ